MDQPPPDCSASCFFAEASCSFSPPGLFLSPRIPPVLCCGSGPLLDQLFTPSLDLFDSIKVPSDLISTLSLPPQIIHSAAPPPPEARRIPPKQGLNKTSRRYRTLPHRATLPLASRRLTPRALRSHSRSSSTAHLDTPKRVL